MGEVCPVVAKTPQIGHKHPLNGACKAHVEYYIEYNCRYVQKKSSKF